MGTRVLERTGFDTGAIWTADLHLVPYHTQKGARYQQLVELEKRLESDSRPIVRPAR